MLKPLLQAHHSTTGEHTFLLWLTESMKGWLCDSLSHAFYSFVYFIYSLSYRDCLALLPWLGNLAGQQTGTAPPAVNVGLSCHSHLAKLHIKLSVFCENN